MAQRLALVCPIEDTGISPPRTVCARSAVGTQPHTLVASLVGTSTLYFFKPETYDWPSLVDNPD